MSWLDGLRRYVRVPLRRKDQIDRAIDDEMRFHLDMRAQELRDSGVPADRAATEALRRFGNITDAREYCRDQDRAREHTRRWSAHLEEAWHDAGIAVRQLRRRPLFATAALVTLALGIGANVAIYSLVNAYLVRPFPFPDDDRIAAIIPAPSREPFPNMPRLGDVDWRPVNEIFDATVAWDLDGFTVVGSGQPEYHDGAWVSPGYFDVLGVRTAVGRAFAADDYQPERRVALISHGLWTRRFGADPAVVGTTVRMHSTDRPNEAELVTIVGVLRADAWHLNRFTDVLRPLTTPRMPSLGRLEPGMGFAEAERQVTAAVRAQVPSADPAWRMWLPPLRDEYVHEVRPMLLTLGAAGALLLLLTCANVAGLLATRGAARRREMSVRAALGAGRGRLARQLMVEATVLTALAGTIGVIVAHVGIRAIADTVQSRLRAAIPGGDAMLRVDGVVLAVAIGACAIAVLLIGARNAFVGSRSDLIGALRLAGAGAGEVDRRSRARLLVVQIALAFALLLGAGLTLRSAATMSNVVLGFEPAGVLKAHVLLPTSRYADADARRRAMDIAIDRIASEPGVTHVAAVFPHPFRPFMPIPAASEATADNDPTRLPRVVSHTITSSYFDVLGIPLLAGRAFGAIDRDGPPVAVISSDLAWRLWGRESAIGRRVRVGTGETAQWRTVVGVVRDVRKTIAQELLPDVYVPFDQQPRAYMAIVARGRVDAESIVLPLRRGLAAVDPALAPSDVAPLAEAIEGETARPRALAALLTGFATFALLLAALGLGGAMANIIVQRQRELAVRMAVGATGADVLRLLLSDAARVIAIGLVLGAGAAFALGRVLASQLYGVTANDPRTYALVATVLAVVAIFAAAVPGLRATRIEPATVLRDG
jgi:putative ABC transport system permease protein